MPGRHGLRGLRWRYDPACGPRRCDGTINFDETRGRDEAACEDLGFDSGMTTRDAASWTPVRASTCGNGNITAGEQCERINGETCGSLGFAGPTPWTSPMTACSPG